MSLFLVICHLPCSQIYDILSPLQCSFLSLDNGLSQLNHQQAPPSSPSSLTRFPSDSHPPVKTQLPLLLFPVEALVTTNITLQLKVRNGVRTPMLWVFGLSFPSLSYLNYFVPWLEPPENYIPGCNWPFPAPMPDAEALMGNQTQNHTWVDSEFLVDYRNQL